MVYWKVLIKHNKLGSQFRPTTKFYVMSKSIYNIMYLSIIYLYIIPYTFYLKISVVGLP